VPNELQHLARELNSRDPTIGLSAVAALRRLVEELEVAHVQHARAEGMSWQAIADVLGISRQAVHKKHTRVGVLRRRRR
jgi:DNA-binding NtrC family response regulator